MSQPAEGDTNEPPNAPQAPIDNDLGEQWRRAMAEAAEEIPDVHPSLVILSDDEAATIKPKNDPGRMGLTEYEWDMACRVKNEFRQKENDLDSMPDYWYAQLAITCQDDAQLAIEMAQGIQIFKTEYDIRDALEEGCWAVRQLTELLPRMILSFSFVDTRGSYLLAQDPSMIDATVANSSVRNMRIFMMGYYYLFHAYTCDMEAIRKGVLILVDAMNVGWKNKNAFKLFKNMAEQLALKYPCAACVNHYNTGVVFNMLFSMVQKIARQDPRLQIKVGCTSDTPLGDTLLVPTVEAANKRLINSLEEALKRRYDNEKEFVLCAEKGGCD